MGMSRAPYAPGDKVKGGVRLDWCYGTTRAGGSLLDWSFGLYACGDKVRGRVQASWLDQSFGTAMSRASKLAWSIFWYINIKSARNIISYARGDNKVPAREILHERELAHFPFLSIGRFFGTVQAPAMKLYHKIVPPPHSFFSVTDWALSNIRKLHPSISLEVNILRLCPKWDFLFFDMPSKSLNGSFFDFQFPGTRS